MCTLIISIGFRRIVAIEDPVAEAIIVPRSLILVPTLHHNRDKGSFEEESQHVLSIKIEMWNVE
jgi:hypothetical protein